MASDSASGAFEVCGECGSPCVNLELHRQNKHENQLADLEDVDLEEFDDQDLLVRSPRQVSGVAHLPDETGQPICGKTAKDTQWRTDGWYHIAANVLPNHRLCKHCQLARLNRGDE